MRELYLWVQHKTLNINILHILGRINSSTLIHIKHYISANCIAPFCPVLLQDEDIQEETDPFRSVSLYIDIAIRLVERSWIYALIGELLELCNYAWAVLLEGYTEPA